MFILNKKSGMIQEFSNEDVIRQLSKDDDYIVAESPEACLAALDAKACSEEPVEDVPEVKEAETEEVAKPAEKPSRSKLKAMKPRISASRITPTWTRRPLSRSFWPTKEVPALTPVEKLKKMTGETDEGLLELLYETAVTEVLALTNRTKLNTALTAAAEKWALIAWNRLGLEGESSRSEAGISSTFIDVPEQIRGIINLNRIARCGGVAHEAESGDASGVLPETSDSNED